MSLVPVGGAFASAVLKYNAKTSDTTLKYKYELENGTALKRLINSALFGDGLNDDRACAIHLFFRLFIYFLIF